MATITLPANTYFEKVDKLRLLRAGVSLRSRYTGKRQSVNFPFAVWYFEGKLLPMSGVDANAWRSFLVKLEGLKNNFKLPVPGYSKPSTGYVGAITVGTGGVSARATSMPIAGAASTAILKEGDYFTVGDELKVATADLTLGGAGTGTLSFQPPLRKALTAGAAITTVNPYILLCAEASDVAGWELTRPVRHGIKLVCVEDIT